MFILMWIRKIVIETEIRRVLVRVVRIIKVTSPSPSRCCFSATMLSTPACGLLPGTRLILSRWLSYQIIPSTGIYLKTVTDIEIQIVLVRDICIVPRSCFSATVLSTRAFGLLRGVLTSKLTLLLTLVYVVFIVPVVLYWLPKMNIAPVSRLLRCLLPRSACSKVQSH